jgi:hypothetical protein
LNDDPFCFNAPWTYMFVYLLLLRYFKRDQI